MISPQTASLLEDFESQCQCNCRWLWHLNKLLQHQASALKIAHKMSKCDIADSEDMSSHLILCYCPRHNEAWCGPTAMGCWRQSPAVPDILEGAQYVYPRVCQHDPCLCGVLY